MKWTTETPTEDGFWWFRLNKEHVSVDEVKIINGVACVPDYYNDELKWLPIATLRKHRGETSREWSDCPIPLPENDIG